MINIKTMELIDISFNALRNIQASGLVDVYSESVVLSVAPGTKIDNVEALGRIEHAELGYGASFGSKRKGDFISVEFGKGRGLWIYQPLIPPSHQEVPKDIEDVFFGNLSAEEWARAVWEPNFYEDPETLKTWLFKIPTGLILVALQLRVSSCEDVELWSIQVYALSEEDWNGLKPFQNYYWFSRTATAFTKNLALTKGIHPDVDTAKSLMLYEISNGLHEAFRHAYNFLSTAKPA